MEFFNISVDSNHILFFGSLLYAFSIPFLQKLLQNNHKFDLLNNDKQIYVVTNILKSFILMILSVIFLYIISSGQLDIFHIKNGWDKNKNILCCTCAIYSITDLVSLLLNGRKMPITTKFHHICVVLAYGYTVTSDMNKYGIYQSIVVYGGFSSIPFLVNLYLGTRFIFTPSRIFKYTCLIIYGISCSLNWTWQLWFLFNVLYYCDSVRTVGSLIMFCMMLYHWIVDDIILMKYLAK